MNIADTIDSAKRSFAIAGRGCLVRIGEDAPRYATVTEIAGRLEPHSEATMLLTAISEAVERYNPKTEAVILLDTNARSARARAGEAGVKAEPQHAHRRSASSRRRSGRVSAAARA